MDSNSIQVLKLAPVLSYIFKFNRPFQFHVNPKQYRIQVLTNIASDHCSLEYQCSTTFSQANTFRFENYWLKLEEFRSMVQTI
jgi:hypothetical protein